MAGGGVNMYDEPIRVMFNVYEPESPNEAGLCKIYGEQESSNERPCLRYMKSRSGQMRGRVQDI